MRFRKSYLSAALLGLVLPCSARAFSDPQLFPDIPEGGGGGGRFFTGSPPDGYTCAVCHSGGIEPVVTVRGLPDLYTPGEVYEIQVDWLNPEAAHALNLEIVDDAGKAAGTLSLPAEDSIDASGRCDRKSDGDVAAFLMEHAARQIVGVSDCGAQTLRFRFKAPDVPSVALAGAVVRGDGSETSEGDGVLEIKRVLQRRNYSLVNPYASQCSFRPGAKSSPLLSVMGALFALVLRRRRSTKVETE